jgi:sRNA-binding carbon storage regulator CsrA
MQTTPILRRTGDALDVGAARVTVVALGAGWVILSVAHPDGVRVVRAEVTDAVRPAEPERRESA